MGRLPSLPHRAAEGARFSVPVLDALTLEPAGSSGWK